MKTNAPVLYPNEEAAERVTAYAEAKSGKLPGALAKYHAWVLTQDRPNLTISPFQAQCLMWLAQTAAVKRGKLLVPFFSPSLPLPPAGCLPADGVKPVLEIGVFRGFSSMVWSHAVGPDGAVTGLELSDEYAAAARAGFAEYAIRNCEVIVGDALETLASLEPAEPFDLVFIDAQKSGYPGYLQTLLDRSRPGAARRLLRPGSLIVADNVLRRGLVADASPANPARQRYPEMARSGYATDHDVEALEEFNTALASSPRIDAVLLPLFDGLGLGRLLD